MSTAPPPAMSGAPVLIVPACGKGRGGGHLSRSLFLKRRLEEEGREAYLWIPESVKDEVLNRFKHLFKNTDTRIFSKEEDISGRTWNFIVLDNFRTSRKEYAFWAGLSQKGRFPLIGIDEGGPCRKRFDFLIDLLPSLEKLKPDISAPWLLPLPKKRRPAFMKESEVSEENPLRVLISFGAEDSAELGYYAARRLARQKTAMQEITLIAPNRDGIDESELCGINVIGNVGDLRERMAEYDLFITHFGLGAFEAIYARVPVLLLSPTAYHEKLKTAAGFAGARHLFSYDDGGFFNREFLETLCQQCGEIARRYGLEEDQKEDLASFINRYDFRRR